MEMSSLLNATSPPPHSNNLIRYIHLNTVNTKIKTGHPITIKNQFGNKMVGLDYSTMFYVQRKK
jgi:hypothetical protein